jgi:hypothetical protein
MAARSRPYGRGCLSSAGGATDLSAAHAERGRGASTGRTVTRSRWLSPRNAPSRVWGRARRVRSICTRLPRCLTRYSDLARTTPWRSLGSGNTGARPSHCVMSPRTSSPVRRCGAGPCWRLSRMPSMSRSGRLTGPPGAPSELWPSAGQSCVSMTDRPLAQPVGKPQPQHLAYLPHRQTLTWHSDPPVWQRIGTIRG